ncbi:hypothetical protein [Leptolyngbya sp. NIES-2104]|uniref:hypothetical protein n=1 Tax=Leptolyngbya sp. NIES-2104 TaxID=1552121 RepID=UPI0006ECC3B7|nr:hypothetical protein [Leptolyngbya sp. NIES-2104]GAP95853.1 hypothetical protein NIES2104_23790 [Leptolyngbya sp. NIES-2104]
MREIEATGSDEFDPENDSKQRILADFKESLRQSESGQTLPLSELWDGIDEIQYEQNTPELSNEVLSMGAETLFLSLDEFETQDERQLY